MGEKKYLKARAAWEMVRLAEYGFLQLQKEKKKALDLEDKTKVKQKNL